MINKKIIIVLFALLAILYSLYLLHGECTKDFKVYPDKGYCEFDLKACQGVWGCKEYNNIQVPCGSVSTLCGDKVVCDCENKE